MPNGSHTLSSFFMPRMQETHLPGIFRSPSVKAKHDKGFFWLRETFFVPTAVWLLFAARNIHFEFACRLFPRAMGKRSDLGKLMVFPPLARGPKEEFRLALCHRGTPDFGRAGKVASLLVFYLCLLESFRKVFVSLEARKWQSCTVGA